MEKYKGLKRLFNKVTIIFCFIALASVNGFATTLRVGTPEVVLVAGQMLEVPLYSTKNISGDLMARGNFNSEDVTFTASPTCHLSATNCTLLIKTSPSSKKYTSVPVVVSESGASNKPVFILSVIRPGDPLPGKTKLPEILSKPLKFSDKTGSKLTFTFTNNTSAILKNLKAINLPNGVSSSICQKVAPGGTCTFILGMHDLAEAGDYVISIQSLQGVLQHRIFSVIRHKIITQNSVDNLSSRPVVDLTAGSLSAVIEPHSISTAYYANTSNGPVYQLINITNNGAGSVTLDTPAISGTDAAIFSIDTNTSDYQGSPTLLIAK